MAKQKDIQTVSIAEALEKGGGNIMLFPIETIAGWLEERGFIHNPDKSDSNGWQIDFWEYFDHPELGEWMLSGSLWYGDYKLIKLKK